MKRTPLIRPFVANHFTYDWRSTLSDVASAPSVTVPNQVLSIPEILKRFASGMTVPMATAVNIDADMSAYDKLDVFQRIDAKRILDARVAVLREKTESDRADLARKQAAIDFEAAVVKRADDLFKSINQSNNSNSNG